MHAIRTDNLTRVYERRRKSQFTAVDGLSLDVQEGRAFAFLGPNGAGKTTTIHLLLGLRRPTSGDGQIFGEPLGSVKAKARIGFLPEDMRPKPYYTTEEMLGYCARLSGISDTAAASRIDYLLSALSLQETRTRRTSRLSKGMVQRLGLAQALISDPDLLVLDEPTSNLDPVGRRDVMRLLRQLKERGTTIFISSHVLSEVEAVCDDVAIISRGRLVRQASFADLASEAGACDITTRALPDQVSQEIAAAGGRIETPADDAAVIWVPDEDAQQRVIALLVRAGRPVLSTGKRTSTLEEVFFRALGEEADQ